MNHKELRRWTALVAFDGDVQEEIDVDAATKADARRAAQAILDRDYDPGGRITKVIGPREGMYL